MLLLTQSVKCVLAKLKLHTRDIVGKTRRLCLLFFRLAVLICYLYIPKPFFLHFEALCWSIFWSKLTYSSFRGGQICFWINDEWFELFEGKFSNSLACAIFLSRLSAYAIFTLFMSQVKCFLLQELDVTFKLLHILLVVGRVWRDHKIVSILINYLKIQKIWGLNTVILQSICNWQVKS